jgi:hypothetical protein
MHKHMTIKEVAHKSGVSDCAVKDNIEVLLPLLPIEDRVLVMEYMVYSRCRLTLVEYVYLFMCRGG